MYFSKDFIPAKPMTLLSLGINKYKDEKDIVSIYLVYYYTF